MSRAIAVGILATLILPALAHAQRTDSSYTSKYNVLSDHNIFMKERGHPSTRPAATQSSPRDPERSVWLAGVVLEDDGYRAYVENQNVGTIMKLAVGDAIARGTIVAIEIDAIAYQSSGRVTWIEVGRDFANHPVEVVGESMSASVEVTPTTSPSGASPGAGAPTAAAVNPNDPNLSVEQRMKLRRMQELKGK
jgi:hypothetical protein